MRTSLENEFRSRARGAVQVKSEKSEAQDTGDSDSDVHRTKKRKTTRGLEEPVLSTRSDARAEQSPCPTKGVVSTEIKVLKEVHTMEVLALKKEHQTALKKALFEDRRMHEDK